VAPRLDYVLNVELSGSFWGPFPLNILADSTTPTA
jgi:hypothetical protein